MKAAVFHKVENISVALQLRAGIVFFAQDSQYTGGSRGLNYSCGL